VVLEAHNEHQYLNSSAVKLEHELEACNYKTCKLTDTALEEDTLLQRSDKTELQWLERILLEELKEYTDVFLKEALNVLSPYRLYDHKIHIDDLNSFKSLEYSPL